MDVTKIMSKFTNIESALLKRLYKGFTLEDLNKIVVKTISTTEPYWDVEKKYINLMKLYGLMPEPNRFGGYNTDKLTELTKYAKWTVDNIPDDWPNDEVFDFKNIENPIKAEMKRYEVSASESGSQAIYRSGWVEILAWDQEDAEEKGVDDFYDWGGEMEDDDYGDWYGDGIELDDITLKEQRRLARKYGIISHQPVRPGDMINEHIPQPGSSSAEGIKDDNLSYETQYLTLDEILTNIKSIPYYNEVLDDLKDDKEDWAVTQTVKRYAKYWMEHPESLTSEGFPPIQVIGDGLKDGAHRISTLNALANHIDPTNPYWKEVKLEVRFYPIEVVKDIGPTWVKGKLVYDTKDGLKSKSLNESTLKINPELKVDDIVRVIDVDGEHGRMPKRFETYIVVKVGKTYPLMAIRNRGHDNEYYEIRPYPDSSTQFSEFDIKTLYRGDTWIYGNIPMATKVDRKTISESTLKINPELELGDKIRVISVDRDVESKSIKYHIPPPELKPDLYVSYAVVDKESNGSESKYPFRYTLIPEDKYQDYLNGDYWVKRDTSKLLFPWLNQWIYAKETETINEHKKSKFNPQLMVGDEVTVVNVDKSYGTMNTPKHLKDYVVTGIKYRQPENWESVLDIEGPEADTKYYVIVPIGGYSDEEATGRMLSGGGRITEEHLYSTDTWMLRKGFLRGELGEHEEGHQPMSKDEVQTIVDKVYPHIINNLGESMYVDEPPKVELWEDIYARLSKIPGATGDESESSEAQYEDTENKIFVYYPNMKDVKHVIQSLLHEYTHYLQDPDESEENRKDGYENDPYETAASEAEENWEDYMAYLKDNLNEHKTKFNPELMIGDEITVVNLDRLIHHPGYIHSPILHVPYVVTGIKHPNKYQPSNAQTYYDIKLIDKNHEYIDPNNVLRIYEKRLYGNDTWLLRKGFLRGELGEDLKNWSYDGNSIGVEKELDEYCPMGKPNKCKLVDYNNLPDMVKSETIEEQFGKELTMADAIKRDVMKVLSMRFVLTPTEDSNIKDANGQSYAIVDTENPFEEVTIDMLIEPIINMFNDGISGGELSPEDTNIAISGVTDWLSLAMHQTVDLPN